VSNGWFQRDTPGLHVIKQMGATSANDPSTLFARNAVDLAQIVEHMEQGQFDVSG